MSQSHEMGIYIFCGVQTEEDEWFGEVVIEGEKHPTFTIHYKDAAIVAAKVPMKIYHPNKENLLMHQEIISSVMEQKDTVIPISFGNVFKTEKDVEALLKNLYPQFEKLFPEIKGKFELGLKVIGKREWLETEINKHPEVEGMSKKVRGKSEAAGFYDRIRLGGMAQKFFSKIQDDIRTDILEPLETDAEAARQNEPTSERMLLNASFLVDKDNEEPFDRKVNELHEKWKDRVEFNYSGPWPAYNFINLRLKVEET
ncbi:gas vesicle protein GvpF [Virgibacillus dakarensis]|uniref:Protein gvpF n=1 Tax=Lentibacillus populi TaxID=1827502 RepID=A0A9W5TWB3_9BACI|nr:MULTISPECIES: GvpL/GvpF family gas vesicle protein [Bacillaceae]MBT2218412.1 GvpL/GvpF family gas vesicle protein [Virgibacillus dakarensis]MTW87495.1 gas vesicle protein GvpF [Virgibacillus dakarensis]GGB35675.1 protein gvpF [Lentibacillus populi]